MQRKWFRKYCERIGECNDEVVKKIKEKLDKNLNEAVDLIKSNNVDILEVCGMFKKFHYKKWKKYIEKIENKENPLQNINFEWKINIAQYL